MKVKSRAKPFFEISSYHDYVSPSLAGHLLSCASEVKGVSGLVEIGTGGGLESKESLKFLTDIYQEIKADLKLILNQRVLDREFMDQRVLACAEFNDNLNRDILDEDYKTIIGLEDAAGRVVLGPLSKNYARSGGSPIAKIPDFLKGSHVTLFGPPDSAKMAVNAMNSFHRKIKNEPDIISELLKENPDSPMWGADDEDSKTPLRADLMAAGVNLTACFNRDIQVPVDEKNSEYKKYELAKHHLAKPIKRFPGIALPSTFLFFNRNPIPLHLYDFALHLFANWNNEQALTFYVPKLENEDEAKYIHKMVSAAERMIKSLHPTYVLGSVRLMIVLENPRAILRTHEIIDALYPYFVGASLGWHDYLASTARVFKNDHHYRIPVKADPDIVIKYIKASHLLLAEVVGSRGGIKVGGMYGILPLENEISSRSFQITIKGFIKDVIVQLKRDLTGFWVAHPDFVRIGMALVAGWRLYKTGKKKPLAQLITALLDKKYHKEVLDYIAAKDIEGMSIDNPSYVRSLIVADIKESDFIQNNDPEEIRYNVFQSLQYLTDWLSGNGCVALPAIVNGVAVRVMDDLATAERSRWEVWHELHHQRFSIEDFLRIAHEEMHFIRKDLSNSKKIVQVKWTEKTEKWYPIAFRIMLQLMTTKTPPEFASELLMPFTLDEIRNSNDPWHKVNELDPGKYQVSKYVDKFNYYFDACGCQNFAKTMASLPAQDINLAKSIILKFNLNEINEAASFHGDIGENKSTLDANAQSEQAGVLSDSESVRTELREFGAKYNKKFGFKFLISAKDKTSVELLQALKKRMKNAKAKELQNASQAIAEIAILRMSKSRLNLLIEDLESLRAHYKINSASISVTENNQIQSISLGSCTKATWFQLASLSKPLAAAFALDYFTKKNISLETSVNELFRRAKAKFQLQSNINSLWPNQVLLKHLLNHTALDRHYVSGVPLNETLPPAAGLVENLNVINEPGSSFQYSGGGFLVLEHLIESLEKKSIQVVTKEYFKKAGLNDFSFQQKPKSKIEYADGYFDSGVRVPSGRLQFPAFAAGAMGTSESVAVFLNNLTHAYKNANGANGMSHDVAVQMLHSQDRGSYDFMGAAMGLGIFVAEAGYNRLAIHQGANEGFRALFVHCVSGPDTGKGFVILCNADNQGVLFIAQAAQKILQELRIEGVNLAEFNSQFDFKKTKQEQIVNLGYKKLIFDAFEKALPEEIERIEPSQESRIQTQSPLSAYNLAVNSKIISVSNQKFARAENMISPFDPVFDPMLFGKQGKIMDSWESARHNTRSCDFVELNLDQPSTIQFVSLSTKYHDGNHAEYIRILASETADKTGADINWREILPKQKMQGHSYLQIKLPKSEEKFGNVRIEMYPDGGFTRLGLYSHLPSAVLSQFKNQESVQSIRYSDEIPKVHKPLTIPYRASFTEIKKNHIKCKKNKIDYASRAFGGLLIKASNEHYGPAVQVISPFPPLNMFDGLESARSREPEHQEHVTIQLGREIVIGRIVLDFKYFINNNPYHIKVEGYSRGKWTELVSKTEVKPFAGNFKEFKIRNKNLFKKIRLYTYPDGGINRIHVYDK